MGNTAWHNCHPWSGAITEHMDVYQTTSFRHRYTVSVVHPSHGIFDHLAPLIGLIDLRCLPQCFPTRSSFGLPLSNKVVFQSQQQWIRIVAKVQVHFVLCLVLCFCDLGCQVKSLRENCDYRRDPITACHVAASQGIGNIDWSKISKIVALTHWFVVADYKSLFVEAGDSFFRRMILMPCRRDQ